MAKESFMTRHLRKWPQRIPLTLFRPVQLSLSLVMLVLGVLFVAELLGFGSDPRNTLRQSRASMAESLAVQLSVFASVGDEQEVDQAVLSFVSRSADVRAASLVSVDGTVLARHGDVYALDNLVAASTLTHLSIPIMNNGRNWGEVQVVFAPAGLAIRQLHWFLFTGLFSFICFAFFLGKVLNQLDPGRVVPARVETAFDLFSAGVVILDEKLRVVLANQSVSKVLGLSPAEVTGSVIEDWPWQKGDEWQAPWTTNLHSGMAVSDMPAILKSADGVERLFSISCAAVGTDSETRGVLVTLDDLTQLEHRNRKLSNTLTELRRSKEAISKKNEELQLLATTDPLTGIANRRTLMSRLEHEFELALSNQLPLSCIMADIDYFKRVNDNFGHATGDKVIQAVADILQQACRSMDVVGRYGGEEFVMILPGLNADSAARLAEKIRIAVIAAGAKSSIGLSSLSSSFGVAELDSQISNGTALLDAADKALYTAKEGGRNRTEVYNNNMDTSADDTDENEILLSKEDKLLARVIELENLLEERDRSLKSLSDYDSLTGTPMRSLFLQRVDTEVKRANRIGMVVGVMSIELRDLERIISCFGHAETDILIIEFVERLQASLRTTDVVSNLTDEHSLSRITSNEYGVLLSDMDDSASSMIVVTRLKRLLLKPFKMGREFVYVGANIGISVSEDGCNESTELFKKASDARLEASKKPDKVSHAFALPALNDKSHDYIKLESDLHKALDNGDLETWFQPKFDLVERRVVGMEALLRWQHKTRGFVSPDVFVSVAEGNGMIGRLSSFVLDKTLKQIKLWQSMGFDDLCISVNVSPMQLRAKSLVDDILMALNQAGVAGKYLEIELTETSVLENPEEARVTLNILRSEGVGVSMDDFGTGYTSLALLASLPLDTVKIDRSFVVNMSTSERSRALVKSIITMSHALGLRVIAEGVETNEELELLSDYECDEVQGYLISRPQSADDITAFLVKQRAAESGRRRA